MPRRDPYANTARGRRGTSGRVSEEEQKANMKSFLTGLSYIIPAGLTFNALRIAYRAVKAGKAATGLVKKAKAVVNTNKTAGASKVKTAGERAAENNLATAKAQIAKTKANKIKAKAAGNARMAGASGGAVLLASGVGAGSKTKTKKPTSTKTKSTSSTTAVPPKKKASAPTPKTSRQGNIGRTTTKYDTPKGKAKVEKLPADVKKKKSGPSFGKDYDSYMNSYFNRRK